MGTFVKLGDYDFPNLRKVTLNSVDYIPGGTFGGMQNLEEIVVNGLVGHFDCWFVGHCPKLRKVVFMALFQAQEARVSNTTALSLTVYCSMAWSPIFISARFRMKRRQSSETIR